MLPNGTTTPVSPPILLMPCISYFNPVPLIFLKLVLDLCIWRTQAQDPGCPNNAGCCMLPLCTDISDETKLYCYDK